MFKIRKLLKSLFLMFSISASAHAADISDKKIDLEKFKTLLRDYLFDAYKVETNVHIESTLSALGALSGFALQKGIREELIDKQGKTESEIFTIVETENGDTYYFGEIFDDPLYDTREGRFSVWVTIANGVWKAGEEALPDIDAMAKANAKAVGSKAYGIPTVPPRNQPKDRPITALRKHWEFAHKLLRQRDTEPLLWSWEIALVAQDVIVAGKEAISPTIASQIVMESAISMSKIDPKKVIEK